MGSVRSTRMEVWGVSWFYGFLFGDCKACRTFTCVCVCFFENSLLSTGHCSYSKAGLSVEQQD